MRQFQFEYDNKAQFIRNLAIIKRYLKKNKSSCVLLQGFCNEIDRDNLVNDCKMLSEEIPEAIYYGCSTYGNINSGKFSNVYANVTCTIFEDANTWIEIKTLEPDNPDAEFSTMQQLWDYCNNESDVVAVEILADLWAAQKFNLGNERVSLRENIAVFGGIAANPKNLLGETIIFSSNNQRTDNNFIAVIYHGTDLHVNTSYILGWRPLGKTMKATSCAGNVLKELDGISAFDVYRKYLNIKNAPEAIYYTAQFPLLVEKAGISCARNIVDISENEEITLTVNIDYGARVTLAYADKNIILEEVKQKFDELAGYTPDIIKIYSCASRRMFWTDNEIGRESEPMETLAPTSGFYTAGELLRIGDFLHNLNTTMVVVAIREGEVLEYGYDIRDEFKVTHNDTGVVARLVHYVQQVENELQGQYSTSLQTIASIYNTMYFINLKQGDVIPVKSHRYSTISEIKNNSNISEYISEGFVPAIKSKYREEARTFLDFSTIDRRMKELDIIDTELESIKMGWLRVQLIVVSRNYEGKIEDVVLTSQRIDDIVQQKRMLEKAKKENAAKSVFLANMSHEIRTPINSILGFDTMILREAKEKEVREYAIKIKESGDTLLELVNSILDISKISSGRMELVELSYDVEVLIKSVFNMVCDRAHKKDLVLLVDVSSDIPKQMKGDETKIRLILVNLLTNAIKYTERGYIKLSVKCEIRDSKCLITYSVQDTGIGIKKKDINSLFTRFTRFDQEKNRYKEGTGLGLSLVESFLKLMHSEPKVESVYGEGSDFYFTLEQEIVDATPVGEFNVSNSIAIANTEYEVGFVAPEAKVLVVDDTPTNLDVFCALLKETMVQITCADSGAEALRLTSEEKYDIIFLDHMMPKMDGIVTLHGMKADRINKNHDTPVYVLTANAIQGMREMYIKEGFDGYLSKPLNPELLEKTVFELLPKELVHPAEKDFSSGEVKAQLEESSAFPIINGINWNYAMLHLGKADLVRKTVESFCRNAKKDADKLKNLWKEIHTAEGLKEYRVQVHAMKNSGMLIGIFPISGMALTLEMAADSASLTTIEDMTGYFLQTWLKYTDELKEAFGVREMVVANLPRCPKEKFTNMMQEMLEAMNIFDIAAADAICMELMKYSYADDVTKKVKTLLDAVSNMDSDTAEAVAGELLQKE